MPLESIDVSGPETPERSQPGIEFLKRFRFQAVETPLGVNGRFHEAGIAQHAQVFGHHGLRHAKVALDFSYRLLRGNEQAQYRAAVWLRNDFEYRLHPFYILRRVYACQGI